MASGTETGDDAGIAPSPAGLAPPPSPRRKEGRRKGPPSGRRRARELALQGLYGWLLGGVDAAAADAHVREQEDFAGADVAHFELLLHGCIGEAKALDVLILPHLDRRPELLSPIEHAALLIGTYELRHCIDIPYRVAINEAVELAKTFGGTDGHKYVNGVLDKLAGELRRVEVDKARR